MWLCERKAFRGNSIGYTTRFFFFFLFLRVIRMWQLYFYPSVKRLNDIFTIVNVQAFRVIFLPIAFRGPVVSIRFSGQTSRRRNDYGPWEPYRVTTYLSRGIACRLWRGQTNLLRPGAHLSGIPRELIALIATTRLNLPFVCRPRQQCLKTFDFTVKSASVAPSFFSKIVRFSRLKELWQYLENTFVRLRGKSHSFFYFIQNTRAAKCFSPTVRCSVHIF